MSEGADNLVPCNAWAVKNLLKLRNSVGSVASSEIDYTPHERGKPSDFPEGDRFVLRPCRHCFYGALYVPLVERDLGTNDGQAHELYCRVVRESLGQIVS